MKKHNVLKVGISPDFPPFAMKVNGELKGYDVEMIQKIGKALNKRIEFYEMDFNALIPTLLAHKIDVAISGISSTEQRRQKVLFSKPYYSEKNCFLFNQSKNRFTSLEEVKDKKVAATLGTTQQNIVSKYFSHCKFYNNTFQIVEEIQIGRIDGLVVGEAQCLEFVKKYPTLGYFLLPNAYNEESSFAIAMRKEDQKLADNINKIIDNGF